MESNLTSLQYFELLRSSKYVVLCAIPLAYQLDLKTENYTQLCREIEMMNTQNGANVPVSTVLLHLFLKLWELLNPSISMSLVFTVKFQAKQANGVKIDL
ncbi:putative acetate--CoA ligase [Trichinella spiralis]|uniref:Uncharacterized protein n=1 Tax=Trichinella spiralis TaxID=6334 RepID=E5S2G2_TRISP|nr:putative acetate--CoA ligase [Trichinella spiralis]KRY30548.1 hypothetical protein T01_13626 [Trichinella spiralis]